MDSANVGEDKKNVELCIGVNMRHALLKFETTSFSKTDWHNW